MMWRAVVVVVSVPTAPVIAFLPPFLPYPTLLALSSPLGMLRAFFFFFSFLSRPRCFFFSILHV